MKNRPDEYQAYPISEAQIVSSAPDDSASASDSAGGGGGGGLNLREIFFILFSHKWKILIFGLIGLIAAACLYFLKDPLYESQAKLLVHYVIETNAIDQLEDQVISGRNMAAALNDEVEIMTSWDLCTRVAESIVESELIVLDMLLPDADKPVSVSAATIAIRNGLRADIRKSSNVIYVSYQHADPDVPIVVLGKLVDQYIMKHLKTHRSSDAVAGWDAKISRVENELENIEGQIERLTKNVSSVEDERAALNARKQKAAEELVIAQADLAAQKLRIEGARIQPDPTESEAQPSEAMPDPPAKSDIEKFRSLLRELEILNSRLIAESIVHKPGSDKIRTIQRQVDLAENKKLELLEQFPTLDVIASPASDLTLPGIQLDPRVELARYGEIEARIKSLENERVSVDSQLQGVGKIATSLAPLLRRKELGEVRLRNLEVARTKADDSQISTEDAIENGLPNITPVQEPSPVVPVAAPGVMKAVLALAFGGFAFGIGLAFLIEMFLDRSVKRPQEFESRLRLPLMLSIPYLKSQEGEKKLLALPEHELEGLTEGAKPARKKRQELAANTSTPWDPHHFIRPFSDAVRDRLGYHFQLHQMTHKPKLVAVTGFSDGAGTSSLACGLAASLAETDGKVLYVDLTSSGNVGAGDQLSDSDGDAGGGESSGNELGLKEQQENLFIARVGSDDRNGRPRPFMPKKLYDLIPKFKSSDFDYVIFDMPPLGPTSPTLAMAGFMDKVLMVVDAGKTNRDVIKHGYDELIAAKADVSTVLNKTRENLPVWLQG